MAVWTWVLVFLFLQTAEVESKNELAHDVETFGEVYELRQKLKQKEQNVTELVRENMECRAKFAVFGQQTRYARSLNEQGGSCIEKLRSCTERLGSWVELARNFTTGGDRACDKTIRFAGSLLLKTAGLD